MSISNMSRVRSRAACVPVTAAMLLGLSCASMATAQSIVSIGVSPGGSWSGASAVSGNGSAVAANVDMMSAHRWTGSGLTNIGLLPGAFAGSAEDISADGSAIVGNAFFDVPEETVRAYRWTSSGDMQNLGTLDGHFASIGYGISGDGSIVTGASLDADFNSMAFRWTSANGMQSLGTLNGGISSEGRRVSHDGSTIIGVSGSADGDRAFRWTSAGGMQNLGVLSSEDVSSSAYGVSADGSVVTGFSGNVAVIWVNGVAQSLGALNGADFAVAYTSNADGSVIGGYSFIGFSARATMWSQELGLVDLNTYLPTLGIDLTGWELQYARDISLDGSTIVGEGMFNGELRGWVVTVPAPGSAGVLIAAGAMMSRRRRA